MNKSVCGSLPVLGLCNPVYQNDFTTLVAGDCNVDDPTEEGKCNESDWYLLMSICVQCFEGKRVDTQAVLSRLTLTPRFKLIKEIIIKKHQHDTGGCTWL